MSMRNLLQTASITLFLALVIGAARGEDAPLKIQETWSNFFGGREATFHVIASPAGGTVDRLGWSLSVAGRTVARGEGSSAGPAGTSITVTIPEVKEGVVMDAVLSMSAVDRTEQAAANKVLWLFPENPFAGRTEWLKKVGISLFDPENTTADALTKLEVPFTAVRNPAAFADSTSRLLLIGEGVSLGNYPGLFDEMLRATQAGHAVLCLAPSDGSLALPGTQGFQGPRPVSMRFLQNAVITELDKRLDAEAWPADGRVTARELVLKSERQIVAGEFLAEGEGWPWFEAKFPGGGQLVICGFAVMEKWAEGPAPRFLLARVIENLFPNREEKETQP
ncbi:MAG TPA: hypothetical protein DCZ95_19685 [Verrucomicrobia bacterium]|nr:MAG: hypothetical protein A2X46_10910 [Lentisphaerae bacterium GWF2_57_35]HBA86308.1 hypothetical protein [Verrucomicrobiota bacterium]